VSDYCPKCFEKLDFLHTCGSAQSSESINTDAFFDSPKSKKSSLVVLVSIAPLAGLAVDLFTPLPSSLAHSLFAALVGSSLVGLLWILTSYEGPKSGKFILQNIKNFAFTPNMLKIFSRENPKKATTAWFGALAISVAAQLFIFTPGNASYLEHQITKEIDDASGANLKVKCPGMSFYLYVDKIECRIQTGLLGISVPARAKISPLVGSADIKVSLL
jgi:hypothetical protein